MFGKRFGKARDARKQRGDSSRPGERWRCRPHVEDLERREVPSCTAAILSARLTISCANSDATTLTLDHVGSLSQEAVVINGAPMTFADSLYNSININSALPQLTTNIQGMIRPLAFSGDGGTVNIGSADNRLDNIQGTLHFEHYLDPTTVNIHDENDANDRTIKVDVNGPYESVIAEFAEIDCHQGAVGTLNINTNINRNTTVNVAGTQSGIRTAIKYAPEVNVGIGSGLPGTLAHIDGEVDVLDEPRLGDLNIHDEADGVSRMATVDAYNISGLSNGLIYANTSYIRNLAVYGGTGNNVYNILYATAQSSFTLDTGGGSDTTIVQNTNVSLAVNTTTGNGGGGRDAVLLGDTNHGLASITSPVTILNNRSTDQIEIADGADGGDHPDVVIADGDAGGVSGLAPAPINITPGSCSTLRLDTGSGHNTFTIAGTPASQGVTLVTDPGGVDAVNVRGNSAPLVVRAQGADTVTLSNTDQTVDGVSNVTVWGNPSSAVVVDDSGYSGDETYSITESSANVARLSDPLLRYIGLGVPVGGLRVLGGDAATNDLFTIDSTYSPVEVVGGAGPNSFSISPVSNSLASIAGLLTVTGSGADVVSFWDQLNPASETYTFDAVPGTLTLATIPVEVDFSGMGGGVYLQTNGASTVDDPSGSVIVDGEPPFVAQRPGGPEMSPAVAANAGVPARTTAPTLDVPASSSLPEIVWLAPGRSHARVPAKSLDWLAVDDVFSL